MSVIGALRRNELDSLELYRLCLEGHPFIHDFLARASTLLSQPNVMKRFTFSSVKPNHHQLLQERFVEECGENPGAKVILGFHGTDVKNLDQIFQTGLLEEFRGTAHGQAYGKGEYFSSNPLYAAQYSKGAKHLLICALLITPSVTFHQEMMVIENNGHHLPLGSIQLHPPTCSRAGLTESAMIQNVLTMAPLLKKRSYPRKEERHKRQKL